MTGGAETLERELVNDLASLEERFADEEFSTELYRALAGDTWTKDGGPPGHVALSWSRAEQVVNELRGRHARQPLALPQTGGEGEVSCVVADELGRLGWRSRPLNTSPHDAQHLAQPESPPPPGHGERFAPVGDASEWARHGHGEAETNRPPQVARRLPDDDR